MRHIDRWYHRNDINHFGKIDENAKPVSTDSLPNTEFVAGFDHSEPEPDTTDYFASVDKTRATGFRYTPYKTGSELWRNAANAQLASIAQSNFQR